jgi:3-oxoacyl-(acyl-carrier-protein) synthase/NAD(P)-dependent dehydrogenase (short-subunit alcohol dehydrogenase family)
MLSSEYSRIYSRHVDVDQNSTTEEIARQIAAELGGGREQVEVCYRDNRRYQASLEDAADVAPHAIDLSYRFPDDKILLITGGTRGIGFLCAQHFVRRHGAKRLVLAGRESFPERTEWRQLLETQAPIAPKIRAVLSLEAEGAAVEVVAVSLVDEAALRKCIEGLEQCLGPVGGVLHCAGMVDGKQPAFVYKRPESIADVMSPKVAGLDNLLNILASKPLEFFVLFSSVSAAIPRLAVGQADYATANAYMDYVAQAHRGTCRLTSIQWPSWRDAGMGETRSAVYRESGLLSLASEQGLRILDRILIEKLAPVVMPVIVDTARWEPAALLQAKSLTATINGAVQVEIADNSSQTSTVSLVSVRGWLIELAARELKIPAERIDADTPLVDYGVDSIMLAQMVRLIGEHVAAHLDPSIFFEYPTISAFTKWLVGRHAGALRTRSSAVSARSLQESTNLPSDRVEHTKPAAALQPAAATDFAIVGLSCRFPGANNATEYWQLLREGRSSIRRVPRDRSGMSGNYYAGVLDDVTSFDHEFFMISQADARAMDPQALLALEQSLALWCHAGYTAREIKGSPIGVFMGARSLQIADAKALEDADNLIMALGPNYLAANISRFFDLTGPSLVIDTACSSALVAMSMAMRSISSGEILSAVVGGISLLNGDSALQVFERRRILAQGPELHMFDGRANGTILGEGAGMVWIKTVDQALRDGDSIYAVVKAVAINNDGRTAGPAAPNLEAQKAVMRSALANSGRSPQDIGYIEVNGSGTEVTDLLELKAIESVYRPSGGQLCELGSMKPNIGHPLCAEGIASFIKVALMLHQRERVPFLSAREPMRHYDLSASPFRFSLGVGAASDVPRVAAINCFADGGTNAHVILESWQDTEMRANVRRPIPLPPLQKVNCKPEPHVVEVSARVELASMSALEQASADNSRSVREGRTWKGSSDLETQEMPTTTGSNADAVKWMEVEGGGPWKRVRRSNDTRNTTV